MDKHERELIAMGHDHEMAARIVNNIADIERDYHVAFGPLSDRFMDAAAAAILRAVVEPWKTLSSDMGELIMAPEWKQSRGVGHSDVWLELGEVCDDEENEYSWIAAAVRAGPTQLVLELTFRRGLVNAANSVFADDKSMAALLKKGFFRNEAKERLFVPIEIPAGLLANGFIENDLTEAVNPISRAVQLAIAAKTELDALIEQVRAKAKAN
jgi:hypothetical protein